MTIPTTTAAAALTPHPLAGQRCEGETKKATQACNDYLRMGSGRSLQKLHQIYTRSTPELPPTRHIETLKVWSGRYDWQKRAGEYDAEIERQKNEARQEIMQTGLALDYERVIVLKEVADYLFAQIIKTDEEGRRPAVWLADVKGIGRGNNFERVNIERFNAAIISEFRSALDDLAKETGGRKQVTELDVHMARKIEFFEVATEEENGE